MTEFQVRKATEADVPQLAVTLGRAFRDDPAFAHAVPDAERRLRHGRRYFELLLRRIYLPKGEVYTTDGSRAVALWAPPERWQVSLAATLPLFPVMVRAAGRRLPTALRMLSLQESRHKALDEPHLYLAFVGTDSDSQGQGHGTALLQSMLERCDKEVFPAYLEATSPGNRALYHRHGFELLEELRWPDDGPPFWPMWRKPLG